MPKQPKVRFGKGLIIVIVLAVLTVAAGVASIVLLSHNRSIVQVFGGADNVYESAHLEKLTFNGYSLGDTLDAEVREHHVLDASFSYLYDDIAFWAKDGKIAGLGFYTTTIGTDEEVKVDIDEVRIEYDGRRLTTLEDFEETFGIGKEERGGQGDRTVVYSQGNYKLSIQMRDDVVYNVILRQN